MEKKEMVICPKTKGCECDCNHSTPHNRKPNCKTFDKYCNACVPISQPSLPSDLLTKEEIQQCEDDFREDCDLYFSDPTHDLDDADAPRNVLDYVAKAQSLKTSAKYQQEIADLKRQLEEAKLAFNPDYLNVKNMAPVIREQAKQEAYKEVGEWIDKNDDHFVFQFIPECGADLCFLATEGFKNEVPEPDGGAGNCLKRDQCRWANKRLLAGNKFRMLLKSGQLQEGK